MRRSRTVRDDTCFLSSQRERQRLAKEVFAWLKREGRSAIGLVIVVCEIDDAVHVVAAAGIAAKHAVEVEMNAMAVNVVLCLPRGVDHYLWYCGSATAADKEGEAEE